MGCVVSTTTDNLNRFVGLIPVIILIILGCNTSDPADWNELLEDIHHKYPNVRQLSTDALAIWLASSEKQLPLLLDIRSQEEYNVSHLKNARLVNCPSNFHSILGDLPKTTPIVAYCSVGYRSSYMVQKLQDLGYTNVYNLKGSIFVWANEGREVVGRKGPVTAVHPYNQIWGRFLNKRYHPKE